MGIYEGRPDLKLFTAAALILGNSTAVYMAHLSSRLPEAGAGAGRPAAHVGLVPGQPGREQG